MKIFYSPSYTVAAHSLRPSRMRQFQLGDFRK